MEETPRDLVAQKLSKLKRVPYLYGDWNKVEIPHGIPTRKSRASEYVAATQPVNQRLLEIADTFLWRDVASRASMDQRLQPFLTSSSLDPDWNIVDSAFAKVRAIWTEALGTGHPILSAGAALSLMPQSTSPGYPYVRAGLRTKRDARNYILRDVRDVWLAARHGKTLARSIPAFPCMSSARRVVRQRPDNKPRVVWGYPARELTLEAQFTWSLQQVQLPFSGKSINWLDYGKWRAELMPSRGSVASLDFDSFDSRVHGFIIREMFDILEQCIAFENDEQHLVWKYVCDYFIHTPMLWYGTVIQKHHGVPSGSYLTQMIDTMVNMFYVFYAEERNLSTPTEHRLIFDNCRWLGDDSRLNFDQCIPSAFKEQFIPIFPEVGAVVNERKLKYCRYNDTMQGEPDQNIGSFLSRDLYRNYPHLRFDFSKFVGQLLIPEDPEPSVEIALGRIIGLTWAFGFDERAHSLLSDVYHTLTWNTGITEAAYRESSLRELTYQFGLDDFDILQSFPSFLDVKYRYYGYR